MVCIIMQLKNLHCHNCIKNLPFPLFDQQVPYGIAQALVIVPNLNHAVIKRHLSHKAADHLKILTPLRLPASLSPHNHNGSHMFEPPRYQSQSHMGKTTLRQPRRVQ